MRVERRSTFALEERLRTDFACVSLSLRCATLASCVALLECGWVGPDFFLMERSEIW